MSEIRDALITAVIDANEVVLDAERQTQRWSDKRNYLAGVAHLNGVSVEELATHLGQPLETIREWVDPPTE